MCWGEIFCHQSFPFTHKFSSLTHYVYVHELSGYASLIHMLLTLSLPPSSLCRLENVYVHELSGYASLIHMLLTLSPSLLSV